MTNLMLSVVLQQDLLGTCQSSSLCPLYHPHETAWQQNHLVISLLIKVEKGGLGSWLSK